MPVPNNAMAEEAQRGLDWRREFGRGGTEVGIARARDIVNKVDLSDETLGRMVSYFARHEVDKEAEGFRQGEDGYPSNGRIAWALWGGDAGKAWAERQYDMTQENRAEPDALDVGDFVSWSSAGGRARGRITRIARDGTLDVPNTSFSITGTPDNPAALIRVYRDEEATDIIVGHKFSTLTRIDPIVSRSTTYEIEKKMISRKQLSLNCVGLKFADSSSGKFGGYASTFGGIDSYNDTIMKGAYDSVIKSIMNGSARMPKMFVNHKSYEVPIGKWTKMYEDEKGLYIEGELTNGNPEAAIVKAAMQHETIDGLSIGYMLKSSDVEFTEMNGQTVRVIKNISDLAEVSVVTFPADDMARVDLTSVKTSLDQIESIKDFEDFLREAGGFSKSLATATASRAKRLFARSESEELKLPSELQRIIAENLKSSRTL
jgi:HK97 family phage prohead protease